MTGTPGQTAVDANVRVLSGHSGGALDLPAPVDELADVAADSLGWDGTVLPPVKMLGRRVIPVAELVPDAHAERVCLGSAPVLDRTEIATWVWPEMDGRVPPEAARINGVLAPARHWRSALTAAVPFAQFTSAAIVVPQAVTERDDFISACLLRARQFGIAVLSADREGVQLELPGRSPAGGPPMEPTAVSRWVNEVVYERLLASEVPAPAHH